MHCSYLTSPKKTAHGMSTDDTHDYLVSVARELGINISDEKKEYNESKEATKRSGCHTGSKIHSMSFWVELLAERMKEW